MQSSQTKMILPYLGISWKCVPYMIDNILT